MKDLHTVPRLSLISLLILATLSVLPAHGSEPEFGEYDVKAGFILNIAKFVEWPPSKSTGEARETLNLCILGSDPFGSATDQIDGRLVRGKRLLVKHPRSARDVKECDMLFISSSEKERLPGIMEALKGTSILTIGDTNGFGRQGVMINFYLDERKVRFEINPDRAQRAGLTISSQLLKLARIVRSDQ